MIYSKKFSDFVEMAHAKAAFVGTGNPNAKILFVGKEAAIAGDDTAGLAWYKGNAADWAQHIKNGTCEVLEYDVDKESSLYKDFHKKTWAKYQILIQEVRGEGGKLTYRINFLNDVFATEMNDAPCLRSNDANKNSLNERKQFFKDSRFIQEFPVVVLACSNYFTNNDEVREIDSVFGVTYDGDEKGRFIFNKTNHIHLHHSKDRKKLVIHTRQLSADVMNEMLAKMGEIIRTHLESL